MRNWYGYKNWNHWNVSLWINNDEGLYRHAIECVRFNNTKAQAAESMYNFLTEELGTDKTPDGAPYSVSSIRAAMIGLE